MNFVMRKQWTEGNKELTSALPEARTARGHTALWLERWRGESVAEARQGLLMRDHSAISNAMTASGGP